jgi:hypothetical protein
VADAEDVVQETWLRWTASGAAERPEIRDPRAYLVRIVTRLCLNRLRTLARQREDYVGEWLPEPLLTSPDVADDVELAESVSIAMLAVLETLLPTERAVFVLAPDVLVVGDGGGLAPTIPKPVRGAAKLAPVMARFAELAPGAEAFIVDLNGGIGARIDPGGVNDTAVSLVIEDGRITQIYAIRNPHKLQRLGEVVQLQR